MPNADSSSHLATIDSHTRITVLWSLALSIFWVVFLWGFWKHGVYALGLNAFVFLAATLGLFVWQWRREKISPRANFFWLIPTGLIIISFLIYDNPFLKTVDILVLPVSFALFYNYSFLSDKDGIHWHSKFIWRLVFRCLSAVAAIGQSIRLHARLGSAGESRSLSRRIIVGVLLFLALTFTVVLPLLASADASFAGYVDNVMKWFYDLVSESIFYRTVFAAALSVVIVAMVHTWAKPFVFTEKHEDDAPIDSVVAGIVLGGVLVVYLLFMLVQLQQLWVSYLPSSFKATEQLVKGGFWQLLFLTVINAAIYFSTYRRTVPAVQKILAAFMGASLLLLLSAGRRIALYVVYYGFSYEKFYAAYAVIFCAILFVYLVSRLFVRNRADIFRFAVVLFIWMYGLVSIFPLEQFILRSNVALMRLENSKIRLYEMSMLGPDVLGTVKLYERAGLLVEKKVVYDREHPENGQQPFDWKPWIETQESAIRGKAWYERNLSNWLYEIGQ